MDRKEAAKQFKEQKVPQGIFAIRCRPSGATWVDGSRNLNASRNRSWVELRSGHHRDKPLQAEWNTHGEEAFDFEILETLDQDVSPIVVHDLLNKQKAHWTTELKARAL